MRVPKASQVVPASKLDMANRDGVTDSRLQLYKVDANAKPVGGGQQAGTDRKSVV